MDRDTTIDPTEIRDVRIDRFVARGKWFVGVFGVAIVTLIASMAYAAIEGQARLDTIEAERAEDEAVNRQIAADLQALKVQSAEQGERVNALREAFGDSNADLRERIESLREDVRRRPR